MVTFGYLQALVAAVGPAVVARAALRRLAGRRLVAPPPTGEGEASAAAAALGAARSIFPVGDRTARAIYRLALPGAAARARGRARAILGGRVAIFGVVV